MSSSTTKDFSGTPQSSGSGVNVVPNPNPTPNPIQPFPPLNPTTMVSTISTYIVPATLPSPPNPIKPSVPVQSATECKSWGPGRTLY